MSQSLRVFRSGFSMGLAVLAVMSLTAVAALGQMSPDDLGAAPGAAADESFQLGGDLFGGMEVGEESATVVSVSAVFTAPDASRPAELFVTARLEPGWHIYSITQGPGGPIKTQIKLKLPPGVRQTGPFQANPAPKKEKEPAFDNLLVETHEETVTWRAPLAIEAGVDLKKLTIAGAVYAQPCSTSCMMPQDFTFTAALGAAPDIVASTPETNVKHDDLWVVIGLAFLGGLILNLMPCVLPVISLKLLSFLEQGGESRARVLTLNIWYALGLLSVFMVLAVLTATLGMAWGEQFTLPWFKVAMTALVFVMALSFLGVWEIPIPGFVGSGTAGQFQTKEGVQGAFAKGVFATILATPCSGPFLGPIFGYLLAQPPNMAYVVFGSVGLGMASPYLVIGAFPRLIGFLPKPGAWMNTLQQIMGFFLLGTMVYLFWTMTSHYFVPTLALLVGLWFACWWIGRTPLTASAAKRRWAWFGGLGVALFVGLFAFLVLLIEPLIPWLPFSPTLLRASRDEGKTVMVDFTANWCPTCQLNSKLAIEKKAVFEIVERNGVVPLLADWTDRSPALKETLNQLGRNSIPILAIWPAGAPDDKVIILDDVITEGQLIEALEKAGPSRDVPIKTPDALP
ncbi:MAG: thioredoxin family protein [Pirellulales bacterium]|nr:thioredoxin family protein [Pirellulales bacterium]